MKTLGFCSISSAIASLRASRTVISFVDPEANLLQGERVRAVLSVQLPCRIPSDDLDIDESRHAKWSDDLEAAMMLMVQGMVGGRCVED